MKNRELLKKAVSETFLVTDWTLDNGILKADLSIGHEITIDTEIVLEVELNDLIQSAMELGMVEGGNEDEVTLSLNGYDKEMPTDLWWADLSWELQEEIVTEAIKQDITYALSKNWLSFVENNGLIEIKKLSPICRILAKEAVEVFFEAELVSSSKVAA